MTLKQALFNILAILTFEIFADEQVDPLTLSLKERRQYSFDLKQQYENQLLQSLSNNQKKQVLELKTKMNDEHRLYELNSGSGEREEIIIFVSGAPRSGEPSPLTEWIKPLIKLSELGYSIFGHRLEGSDKLEKNSHIIAQQIKNLRMKNSNKKIIIFAHSAGGVIILHMKHQYFNEDDQVEVHTIASPIFGYGFPASPNFLSGLESKFFISAFLKLELGGNMVKKYKIQNLNHCFHHVTTSCSEDISACNYEIFFSGSRRRTRTGKIIKTPKQKINPQVFYSITDEQSLDLDFMPCGEENTIQYHEDNHFTIVEQVIDNTLF